MSMQDILDPSRSLEAWLREKHGLDARELASVRGDFARWMEGMLLRQQDPAVRRSQDMRALRYLSAVPYADLSERDAALLGELRLRVGAG